MQMMFFVKSARLRSMPLAISMILLPASVYAGGIPKPGNPQLDQVRHIGDLPVLKVSPDFYPDVEIQAGTNNPAEKITPKTSREITHNYVGATPPRLPRSEAYDLQPFQRVHLLDGDHETLWMNRGQARPNVQPEWVRIDLPYEQLIRQVTLWPMSPETGGWPANITLQVSRDGMDWKTVYHAPDHPPLTEDGPVNLPFDLQPVKQVLLTVRDLRKVTLVSASGAVGIDNLQVQDYPILLEINL
jgi:hypothetical protein